MNFLAHLLLSGEREGVIVGNYAGDFVKGVLSEQRTAGWNQDYLLGVRLHRFIDSYTDTHPVIRETKKVVALEYGKLAGIVLDIYLDYFLARHFDQFSSEPLHDYAQRMYDIFERNQSLIPLEMKPMVRGMVSQDWLTTYATIEGMALTFGRLSRRASFLLPIHGAAEELRANEVYYYSQYNIFFPELKQQTEHFLEMNAV